MTRILAPGGYGPLVGLAFGGVGEPAIAVSGVTPLPVVGVPGAGAPPVTGRLQATGRSAPIALTVGRAVMLTLSGSWTGTIALRRSIDGGATSAPLTAAGHTIEFDAAVNEVVWVEPEEGAALVLDAVLMDGAVDFRVAA